MHRAKHLDRRLAAIMSVDVVGYSRMMGLDEAGTLQRLNEIRAEVFEPLVGDYGGRIVKLIGDGALLEFGSCVDAVECGLAFQKDMDERNRKIDQSNQITFRVGINLGEVIVQGRDIYGDGVNIAARIEAIAEPGGVALSGAAWAQVEGKIVAVFEDCGAQELKNITHPVSVYRWPNDVEIAPQKMVQAGTGLGLPDKPSV
ncbi:MAG TPA: adenylate/guanylate cyclase domain-containing protein, partial [Paracoccaceae bacterium]|nr:adenylate/guanylate cyclase domain-containing protein [Paracoccaceae bacterium]